MFFIQVNPSKIWANAMNMYDQRICLPGIPDECIFGAMCQGLGEYSNIDQRTAKSDQHSKFGTMRQGLGEYSNIDQRTAKSEFFLVLIFFCCLDAFYENADQFIAFANV